jgi:hypothetical protein
MPWNFLAYCFHAGCQGKHGYSPNLYFRRLTGHTQGRLAAAQGQYWRGVLLLDYSVLQS